MMWRLLQRRPRTHSPDRPLVKLTIPRDDAVHVELAFSEVASVAAEAALEIGMSEDFDRARGHAFDVADGEEGAGFAFDHHLGQASGAAADDRDLGRHRFEGGHAEGFGFGWEEE